MLNIQHQIIELKTKLTQHKEDMRKDPSKKVLYNSLAKISQMHHAIFSVSTMVALIRNVMIDIPLSLFLFKQANKKGKTPVPVAKVSTG